ncbi:ATP-binding protein [Campylobacter fetus]|uniref:ATPase AAA n=1 Tax=Campylobacter fetus subsp. testudinum TaxID=1507806 RepID=A0AAX0HBJ0_CAMFE|nr:ATP-binding protein [Campylobacter fetus]AGZ82461.1 ATPase, AAA family [Campylobacter fetus subsp. testudinum 03-427]AJB46182.1 ATPase AAA [Campylobacter fetus subsp. testudinum]ALV65629.1 ATPase, AAA family [Campylobacter fetus subsp. testudinum Sp3]AVK81871.1 ATP-binding protein [Campylobacter fetus subsp. testudinum]EAI4322557.1 ATP-binding protein [Campylobacter fetus]
MKYLKDFLNDNQSSEIFQILECDKDELEILKYMTRSFIQGVSQMSVFDLLNTVFTDKDFGYLDHISNLKNLIDLGYISQNFSFFKENGKQKSSRLSMLYTEVELSELFLVLLEEGKAPSQVPPNEPYNDHLEYLKDQFLRIELYQKKVSNHSQNSKAKLDKKIAITENLIEHRLKISKIPLACEQIFKENSLNSKEQVIFLALLKEEYSGEFEALRDLNTLISLVSKDDMERMKSRSLLEDGSNLLESGLIDYDEVLNAFGSVSRSFFITEEILQLIMHPQNSKKTKKLKLETLVKESEIFELIEPNSDLSDVVLNEQTKELLDDILKQVDKKVLTRLNTWGIKSRKSAQVKVIFYGSPGTGKTMSALSLAKSLKKQILSFDCSKILSKYVGESEQNVRKIFDTYKEICSKTKTEPVLLLNEADQFLSTRIETSSGSDKMHNQMQNIFLEQIEKFEGVLIATTNFMQSLDHAFSRRFDYKIEFKKPDFKARLEIWKRVLPQNGSFESGFNIEKLAKHALSGAQIMLVLKNAALKTAISEDGVFTMKIFENEIKREISSAFDEDKRVGLL